MLLKDLVLDTEIKVFYGGKYQGVETISSVDTYNNRFSIMYKGKEIYFGYLESSGWRRISENPLGEGWIFSQREEEYTFMVLPDDGELTLQ